VAGARDAGVAAAVEEPEDRDTGDERGSGGGDQPGERAPPVGAGLAGLAIPAVRDA